MSDLLTRPLLRRDEPSWGSRVPWLAGALAAVWALLAGFALSVLPMISIWLSEGALAPVTEPLRLGADLWLLGHRVGVEVDGITMRLAPLGLTILVLLLVYRSSRWAAHTAGAAGGRRALSVILPVAGTYGLGAAVVAGLAATGDVLALPLEAALITACWALLAAGLGVARECGVPESVSDRVPPVVRSAAAGGLAGAAVMVAGSAVLVAVTVVTQREGVMDLVEALDAGTVGTLALVAASVIVLPNALGWAWSVSTGPGFAVGADTSVTAAGVDLGLVPAIPVLGALPESVPALVGWVVPLLPVAAGVIGATVTVRWLRGYGSDTTWWRVGLAGLGTGAAAAVLGAVLAFVSGGVLGAERMAVIGAPVLAVAGSSLLWIGIPAALAATALALRR